MDYPARKSRKKAPEPARVEDRRDLRLAEYSAPLGEELPWRIAEEAPALDERWCDWKPERGRLH